MNHLHELLDVIQQGVIYRDPSILEKDADRYLDWTQQAANKSMCFWMGDVDLVNELRIPPELVRLPFPVCWFEGEVLADDGGHQALIGILATETPGGSSAGEALVFMRANRRWALMLGCSLQFDGGVGVTGFDRDVLPGAKYAMYALKAFCCAINCKNVIQREHSPDAALQKARQKKGKAPVFSYWTLEINGHNGAGQIFGGSHASPRVHLVRGHPRQYEPGKWTWVQPHARGNKSLGMVHKEYNAAPAMLRAANAPDTIANYDHSALGMHQFDLKNTAGATP